MFEKNNNIGKAIEHYFIEVKKKGKFSSVSYEERDYCIKMLIGKHLLIIRKNI